MIYLCVDALSHFYTAVRNDDATIAMKYGNHHGEIVGDF